MTCIAQQTIGTGDRFLVKLYEAPYHSSRSRERRLWIDNGNPFFNREIYALWEIYSTPFSDIEDLSLSPGEEAAERKAYICSPLFVALDREKVVGGAWINKDLLESVLMHIKVLRTKREVADPLLDYALQSLKKKYRQVSVRWGLRDPRDDPSSFFERNGFNVRKLPRGGIASKILDS